MEAVVDTGAVMLSIPQDVIEKLELEIVRKVVFTYADERDEITKGDYGSLLSCQMADFR